MCDSVTLKALGQVPTSSIALVGNGYVMLAAHRKMMAATVQTPVPTL
ncbi:MAG: hypothetical protein WBN53_02065 [Thermodesulfobacteriota bacterium]